MHLVIEGDENGRLPAGERERMLRDTHGYGSGYLTLPKLEFASHLEF